MRRALAALSLSTLSLPLIGVLLLAVTGPNLPECCRRAGEHHCAMSSENPDGGGVSIAGVESRCPFFPRTGGPATSSQPGVPAASVITARFAAITVEVQVPVGFSVICRPGDAAPKRGPPVALD